MTPDRWRDVERLYFAAQQRGPDHWAAFLASACPGDEELRNEVASLLAQGSSHTEGRLEGVPRQIGDYDLLGLLGAGGMGLVYRARDRKLDREVAIKLLPEMFSRDADRRARFQREAKLLAALNHPNIASIYGLAEAGDSSALILELVPGETLADRIARGPIPLNEALAIARQITDALDAAHEQGIIHRDLKPANVRVTPAGVVKVLDFGLAKLLDGGAAAAVPASVAATMTSPAEMTGVGVLLGTAAYMSPEQAQGREVGRGADVWAFGVVLYEMLTGRCAFQGDNVTSTLAKVLETEPSWEGVPPGARRLLERCLEKNEKKRLRAIADASDLLDAESPAGVATDARFATTSTSRRRALLAISAAAAAVPLAALGGFKFASTRRGSAPDPTLFTIDVPSNVVGSLSVSPDGRKVAYASSTGLVVHHFDTGTDQRIAVAATGGLPLPAVWSPDGASLAYYDSRSRELTRVDVKTGVTRRVAKIGGFMGGSWNNSGDILFAQGTPEAAGISRVNANGGEWTRVTTPAPGEVAHILPSFLPDGRGFLFVSGDAPGMTSVHAGWIDGRPPKKLLDGASRPVFVAPYLLFARGSTLIARRFDPGTFALQDAEVTVSPDVAAGPPRPWLPGFSAGSRTLAYISENAEALTRPTQLTWYEPGGRQIRSLDTPAAYQDVAVAPRGKRFVVHKDPDLGAPGKLWVSDPAGNTLTQLTFGEGDDVYPIWAPDGESILFTRGLNGSSNVYRCKLNDPSDLEPTDDVPRDLVPTDWTDKHDGYILVTKGEASGPIQWVMPTLGDRTLRRLGTSAVNGYSAVFSPDGNWISYVTPKGEIHVRSFPDSRGPWPVSSGAAFPRWSPDSMTVYYYSPSSSAIMGVDIRSSRNELSPAPPRQVVNTRVRTSHPSGAPYDVADDGSILVSELVQATTNQARGPLKKMHIVMDWPAALNP